jgi:hypothetical protein
MIEFVINSGTYYLIACAALFLLMVSIGVYEDLFDKPADPNVKSSAFWITVVAISCPVINICTLVFLIVVAISFWLRR